MSTARAAWVGIVMVGLAGLPAGADERKFTYSYEAKTLPSGVLEFEQWITFRTDKGEGDFLRIDLREEFEYGVTDRLTTALYLNLEYLDTDGVPGIGDEKEFEFEGVSSEWKYRLTDATSPVGLLAYGEVGVGEDEFELEAKVVASRDFGPLTVAYNLALEVEWEKEEEPTGEKEWERESQIAHSFGVSCRIGSGVNVGLEGVARQNFEGSFAETENHSYFVGPNLHVATPGWWATLTVLKQVDIKENSGLVLDDQEKYEVRLIFGIHF
jgi:hypothetical protein